MHEGHAARTCCLGSGPSSVNDPCQSNEEYCTSRYVPCQGGLGQRCDLEYAEKCCVSPGADDDNPCAEDCGAWRAHQHTKNAWVRVTAVGVLIIVIVIACYCFRHRRRLCEQLSRFCRTLQNPRNATLLLPTGQVMLQPWREHSVRVALVISNQSYSERPHGYGTLQCAHNDGDAIDASLGSMGYRTMRLRDATRAEIDSAFRSVLQWTSGTNNALVVVYYAGHAVEIPGQSLMWAGVDAPRADPSLHFSTQKCLQGIESMHTVDGAARLGLQDAALNASFVFLADCCRELSEVPDQFGAHLREILAPQSDSNPQQERGRVRRMMRDRNQARQHRLNHSGPALQQACYFIISACRPGQRAFDASDQDNTHSPFTFHLLRHITSVQPLSSLVERLSEGLGDATANQQQATMRSEHSVGEQGGCVSLAPPDFTIPRVPSSTGGSA